MRAGAAFVIPIEEDDHTWCRFDIVICPLASILEPVDTVDTACIFGNNTSLDIPALIGAPRYKAGAPLNARAETVPAPVGLTAHITKLRQRNRNNLIVGSVDAVENRCPHTAVLCEQLSNLGFLILGEAVLRHHFLYGLMAYSDIQVNSCLFDFLFYDVAFSIICFNYDRFCLFLGFIRNLIHFPEDILQKLFLLVSHRRHFLRIIRVVGGFYSVDGKDLRPDCTGA